MKVTSSDSVAAPEGSCIRDVTRGRSQVVLWLSQGSPQQSLSPARRAACLAASVVGVTVLHQAVGDVAAVKDTLVVAFLCKCVHCPGNHLNSSGRPVPHIVPARNRHTLRAAWHYTELTVLRLQLSFGLASAARQGTTVHHVLPHHLFVFSYCKQAKATNTFSLWD